MGTTRHWVLLRSLCSSAKSVAGRKGKEKRKGEKERGENDKTKKQLIERPHSMSVPRRENDQTSQERERERGGGGGSEGEKRERESVCVCVCVCV